MSGNENIQVLQSSRAAATVEEPHRFLTREEAERIIRRALQLTRGGGETTITVTSWWNGELRWARNRTSIASDRRNVYIDIGRQIGPGVSFASTNQIDDISLEGVIRAAERTAQLNGTKVRNIRTPFVEPIVLPSSEPLIWSENTYGLTAVARGAIMRMLSEESEAKGMLSAGYLEMRAGEVATLTTNGEDGGPKNVVRYSQYTQAQCSMTVRHPKGIGSGWAGLASFDWAQIDSRALAKRALDKCLASIDPVAIEPGRYTVVLEPQAVHQLACYLPRFMNGRWHSENGDGMFTLGYDAALNTRRTKLGLKLLDERISITHNPNDPQMGVIPAPGLTPITWVDRGILTTLAYDHKYAVKYLHQNLPATARVSYHMSGGTTAIDEMISTTKRGLLVTRFSKVEPIDFYSGLLTGMTRDGLWLIENGKLTKAVKNLRFMESPFFVFNQVDDLGVPVPVFWPYNNVRIAGLRPAIVPPAKIRDFSFTATADAI
jgi:predicted Zn-dependent protease